MKPATSLVYIIQAADPPAELQSLHGSQGDWFTHALSNLPCTVRVLRPHAGDALPNTDDPHPVIISGSWAMVTDRAPWSEALAHWIRERYHSTAPLLGVCYGHQLMADALGGVVDYHPQGRELGCLNVWQLAQPLLDHEAMLLGTLTHQFPALLTHEQSVLTPPSCARVLMRSDHDPHQMLSYRAGFYSVQFHPEFTVSLLRATIQRRAEQLIAEGYKLDDLLHPLQDTQQARQLLINFVQTYSPALLDAAARKNSPGVSPMSSLNDATKADILS
ncbi:glutamine amidotransferase [Alcaligenes endophyticus]|uniref:Glutamine amidotransferase n=1 Tax=Alcaligenes endophyticus TaxID=1929088 RepID=A0ABT8EK57_9BURK|nr:glutamine amidotransferase [Alcaligenes endophyticus]MCX5591976.1 glutamine amidotransferase [Alcaligenes endophyticus]MDN4121666.1 glutamine amidotransferase [Alcaligenes endophyticus]